MKQLRITKVYCIKLPVCEKSRVRGDGPGYVFTLNSNTAGRNITAPTETSTKARTDINTGTQPNPSFFFTLRYYCVLLMCLCFRSYTSHSFSEHMRTQIKIKSGVL